MIQELLCGGGLLLEERRNNISSTPTLLLPPPDGSSNNHSNSSTPTTTPPHSATSSPNGSATHEHQNLRCPRCDSSNTKFCYYNNYNLTQPRHFCKTCRRYWTKGGALRNVPIGGGCRKTKAVGLSIANKLGSSGNCKANGVVTRPNTTQIPWSSMPTTTPNINSQLIASLVRPSSSSGYTNPFLAKPINQNSAPISSHPLPSYDSSSPTTIMKNPSVTSKLFGLDQKNYNVPTGVCGSLWNNTAQYSNNSSNYYHQQVPPAASRIHHLYQMLKSNSAAAAAADHQNQMLAATTVTSAAAQGSSILDHADHHQDGVGESELWNNWNQLPSLYWSDMPASNANGVALP